MRVPITKRMEMSLLQGWDKDDVLRFVHFALANGTHKSRYK